MWYPRGVPGQFDATMRQLVQDFPGDWLAFLGLPALGLIFPPAVAEQLMPGIRTMRDSLTDQAIVEEGVERGVERGVALEARRLVLELGEDRFGAPDQATADALGEIHDPERLHPLVRRLGRAASWEDLLNDE
jgi:hypothetical protein